MIIRPAEWVAVEVASGRVRDLIAPLVEDLVERGILDILDAVVLRRDEDGTLDVFELVDLDESELGALCAYRTELVTVLGDDAMCDIAAVVTPGATAAVLVGEGNWAAPFRSAVRRAGGEVVASGLVADPAVRTERSVRRRP